MSVQKPRDQRTLKPRAVSAQKIPTRPRDFGTALSFEDAEFRTEFVMRLGFEVELRLAAPGFNHRVIFGGGARGHRRMWNVWHPPQNLITLALNATLLIFKSLNAIAQRF